MSTYKQPWETIAGAFATLIVLLPWQLFKASGWADDPALFACGGVLLGLALVALALRRAPFTDRAYTFAGEPFLLRRLLHHFAGYALAELALAGGILLYLRWFGAHGR